MRTNLTDIAKAIPDFDDMLILADKIRELLLEKLLLDKEIKEKESLVFREAMSNDKYFNSGKPPAVSFVESAYKYTGFSGELIPLRTRLAEVTADLDHARLTMDTYNSMLDVFRTLSANERGQ